MIINSFKKKIALALTMCFLFAGIISVQAAQTTVDCGQTLNTRYSTIVGDDLWYQQSTSGDWRQGGSTVVYIKDDSTGEQAYKTLHSGTRHVYAYLPRPSKTRFHTHFATDHQN